MEQDKNNAINATIKDVARLAKVSIATVSRILNGKETVSPHLVERVMSAVEELRYQPNAVARALKVRESLSMGLIIPDIENPFFPALVRGVEDAAQMHDYSVILCNTDGKPAEEERYIRFLYNKRVDGILFTGGRYSDDNVAMLATLSIPVVLLDRRVGSQLSTVVTDNYLGGFMATEHLIKRGRSRIAFISGPPELSSVQTRREGYVQALRQHGLSYGEELVLPGDFTFESGHRAAARLIADGLSVDAFFAANDMMAIGAIEYLRAYGIRVPEEIAAVGYDDIRMAAWYKPSLTTVRQPVYQMGQCAVRRMLELVSGGVRRYSEEVLRPELVIRDSSGSRGGKEQ
ncbi:laci bacterial regulatory protein hth signature [Lucifera butyrica]|uniref:Laci bacterial regulatory protein hth signature n=1 Tax=Lucifera butyrica TaxID=1351585 RepID=A0A498R202_9FIRM|nr:LacI family DNA-binding transcriptional regulator [Lucifera butyrica]VBB05411.1 laci bacterial regulatory protein hth signature [Lucifera butyrica]